MRMFCASVSAYCAPAAASTCPMESSEVCTWLLGARHWLTTPWNCGRRRPGPGVLEAGEARDHHRDLALDLAEMRATSPDAAAMRSVSTWNWAAIV